MCHVELRYIFSLWNQRKLWWDYSGFPGQNSANHGSSRTKLAFTRIGSTILTVAKSAICSLRVNESGNRNSYYKQSSKMRIKKDYHRRKSSEQIKAKIRLVNMCYLSSKDLKIDVTDLQKYFFRHNLKLTYIWK